MMDSPVVADTSLLLKSQRPRRRKQAEHEAALWVDLGRAVQPKMAIVMATLLISGWGLFGSVDWVGKRSVGR